MRHATTLKDAPQPTSVWVSFGMYFMFSNFYQIIFTQRNLHGQIYDEASTKIRLKIGPSLIKLQLLEVLAS